jgi:hypothetical protein
MPYLKEVHKAFEEEKMLTLVSLNLGADIEAIRTSVSREALPWMQAMASGEKAADVVRQYGCAERCVSTFLIDQKGRLLARDLRGDATTEAVASALGR